MQYYYSRILAAFFCPNHPLTRPSHIIPTLSSSDAQLLQHAPTHRVQLFSLRFTCFFPVRPLLHVDTVSLKPRINVLEIWMRSHACEHSQASIPSVLAVFRWSSTADKHSIRLDKHIQTNGARDELNIYEEKTYAHPLHFGNFVNSLFLPIM